jgi:MoxR-like ATPase
MVQEIIRNITHVIRGKPTAVEQVILGLLSGGHVLVEDVPGVGKTTLAKALSLSIRATFHRIQFTPDLLPTDILGGSVYAPSTGTFTFRPGPIFCNVLLADEINRASPRTQSALLEAMNEGQVSMEGQTFPLPDPFIVIATQNPVEYHGTYPLPEAQLDRFAMQIGIGYPEAADEITLLTDQRDHHPLLDLKAVADEAAVRTAQAAVRAIKVEASLAAYVVDLVRATRADARVRLGASPRASLMLYRTSQALAYLRGRDYVLPDDIRRQAPVVLAHRLSVDLKARHAGVSGADIVRDALASCRVPV